MFLQDTDVLPLVRDGSCWTLGADSADIDYEAAWRQSLRRDHCCRFKGDCKAPLSGNGGAVLLGAEPHQYGAALPEKQECEACTACASGSLPYGINPVRNHQAAASDRSCCLL
jgi:hypothetical protein